MARALISPENGLLRNCSWVAIAAIVIPFVFVVKLLVAPFEKPAPRSADEVLGYLRGFRDGTGDDYDWDDFTCIPIADPALEEVRESAASLNLPCGTEELNKLETLILRTEAIARSQADG